jgi:hypothetical protein
LDEPTLLDDGAQVTRDAVRMVDPKPLPDFAERGAPTRRDSGRDEAVNLSLPIGQFGAFIRFVSFVHGVAVRICGIAGFHVSQFRNSSGNL